MRTEVKKAMALRREDNAFAISTAATKQERDDAVRTHSFLYLADLRSLINQLKSTHMPRKEYCYKHMKICDSIPKLSRATELILCVAGLSCLDWSSMGVEGGNAGEGLLGVL